MLITNNKDISQTPYYTKANSSMVASMSNAAALSPTYPVAMEITTEKESPTKKRKCRKVGFGPSITLAYIESAFDYTQSEKDDRWYRSSTISGFKEDARRLCRGRIEDVRNGCSPRVRVRKTLRTESAPANNDNNNHSQSQSDLSRDSIRGLDVYAPSRQRYTKKYIKHVLEAYHVRCVGNDEHVALLAEKWSKKSLARAVSMGEKDYLAAYFSKEVDGKSLLEENKPMLASTLMNQQQQPTILASQA